MNTPSEAAWYRVPNMASGSNRTIYHAIETGCLAMHKFARQTKKINYVWQPDVFGFPATLPQILKKSGINYIASQKLSQNKIN
ncbi:hypothetical protein KX530_27505, partial [Escherichia coli]|nr:hypothetical protein [Escherichia coli]